jgi:hypothetical protein
VVTLTAAVTTGAAALTPGQVNFCDDAAASCTDIHLLGTAQLTSAGTAVLRFRPGPGRHNYKAVFLGTLAGAPSVSAAAGLTVDPRPPGLQTTFTVAAISGPDAQNRYALTASVGTKGTILPSGTVSFLNVNDGTAQLGTATLGPVSGGTGFLNVPITEPGGSGADALPIIAIGDFNGDGIPDIVSAPHGGIAISLGNGDGSFAAALIPDLDPLDGINAFGVGDFNGDGFADLLVDDEDTSTLTVLIGKGDGTFTVGQSLPFGISSIAIADFNGDGRLDIGLPGNPQTTILLGNGDGTFTAAPPLQQVSSSQLSAADFNHDGKIDLAVIDPGGAVTILLGNGDATFATAPNPPQATASQLVIADFNGDGKLDLATLNPTGDTLTILAGNGDGTFSAASTLPTGMNASSLTVGDFNGDNKPDLAGAGIAAFPDHKITIFAGEGDGTFASGFDVNDPAAQQLAVADLTGSGSSDLATFGSVLLGELTISTATLDISLSTGYNVIRADYPGDATNAPSNSANAPAILVPAPAFSLTSNAIVLTTGTSASGNFSVTTLGVTGTVNLSCSIASLPGQANPPTCSVPASTDLFSANGTVNLSYTVTAPASTPAGQYSFTITAAYAAGGESPASTSATVTVTSPQNYLLSNTGATIASPGASGTSTIRISPSGGFTGQITMSCAVTGAPPGAVDAPTCTIPSPIPVIGPTVTTTLTLNTQPATTSGSYSVTVTGTSAGKPPATTSFTVHVPAAPPDFTLSSTAVTIASPGSGGTSTITITPSGGLTGSIALNCAVSGGPAGGADAPTCLVTAPPMITGATSVTATLTVNTTAASVATYKRPMVHAQHPRRSVAIGGAVFAVASMLWFGFPIRRRKTITELGLLLIATLIGTVIGCGGGKAAAPPAAPPNPGTTPGAYTVTVTGSSGAITATTAVTMTVN